MNLLSFDTTYVNGWVDSFKLTRMGIYSLTILENILNLIRYHFLHLKNIGETKWVSQLDVVYLSRSEKKI